MALTEIKPILGIEDAERDELLGLLYDYSKRAILTCTGFSTFPDDLDWIANEITVIRFNRLNAEGLTEEKIENLTTKYESDILGPYSRFLDEYMRNNPVDSKRGRLKML